MGESGRKDDELSGEREGETHAKAKAERTEEKACGSCHVMSCPVRFGSWRAVPCRVLFCSVHAVSGRVLFCFLRSLSPSSSLRYSLLLCSRTWHGTPRTKQDRTRHDTPRAEQNRARHNTRRTAAAEKHAQTNVMRTRCSGAAHPRRKSM